MQEVWIIDAARSPRGLGRPDKGSLARVHPQRLLSQILTAIAERNQLLHGRYRTRHYGLW